MLGYVVTTLIACASIFFTNWDTVAAEVETRAEKPLRTDAPILLGTEQKEVDMVPITPQGLMSRTPSPSPDVRVT